VMITSLSVAFREHTFRFETSVSNVLKYYEE
jgi:hypothetical protein